MHPRGCQLHPTRVEGTDEEQASHENEGARLTLQVGRRPEGEAGP
jgi:hypothetical protein